MSKRSYLKQIESLKYRIEEHLEKIKTEKEKATPNPGRIWYWAKEIDKFKTEVKKSQKRLRRRK